MDMKELTEIMEPLTRQNSKDGMGTDEFRENLRLQRDMWQKLNSLSAEQIKERIEAQLANGGEVLLSRLNPSNMSEDELREAAENHGCSVEELTAMLNATGEMLRSHVEEFALKVHDAPPEDVKGKLEAIIAKSETI